MNRNRTAAFVIIAALLCVSVIGIAYDGDSDRGSYDGEGGVLPALGAVNEVFIVDNIAYKITWDPSKGNGTASVVKNTSDSPTGDITIPATIKHPTTEKGYEVYIGTYAFEKCTEITSVTISEGVKSIGEFAFRDCTGLTSVTIPASVTYIFDSSFQCCTGLTSIDVDKNNEKYTSEYGALFNKEKTILMQYSAKITADTPVIPDSVNNINNYAFYGCIGLTSVEIPASVKSIGHHAFDGCTGLTSVTIPDSVTSIGQCAFYNCTGLTSVTIPGSVTSIHDKMFENCTELKSVTMLDGVKSIDHYAFAKCGKLTSITIPDSVTSIGQYTFNCCIGLTSVTIPGSVTSINSGAFSNCDGLESITIPGSVTSIEYIFSYCDGLKSVTMLDGVKSIGNSSFNYCAKLETVNIPGSVTSIKDNAFAECKKLTSITIPGSVTSIGKRAFSECTGLTSVEIPASVTSIGSNAFSYCIGLTSVEIPASVTSIGSNTFYKCTGLTNIAVVEGNPSYTSINGALYDKEKTTLITYPAGKTGSLVISDSTSIDDYAFFCSKLKTVVLTDVNTSSENSLLKNITSKWKLPGQSDNQIDMIIIDTEKTIDLPSITPGNGKMFAVLPGTDNVSIGETKLTGGSFYAYDNGWKLSTSEDVAFVILNANCNDGVDGSAVVTPGNLALIANATRAGHVLEGYYLVVGEENVQIADNDCNLVPNVSDYTDADSNWISDNGAEFYAVWTPNEYTITFDSNGGSAVSDITAAYGSAVSEPNDPTRDGYTFAEWYSDEDPTDDVDWTNLTMPLNGTTYYANWIDNYTITFDSNGGSEVSAITAAYGSAVSEPDNPTRDGYTFARWYSDKDLTNDIDWTNLTMPLNGTTYYANWIDNYTITFDSNGGSEVSAITAAYGSAVSEPDNPTRGGYTFARWYSDKDLTNDIDWTNLTMPLNGTTYYAKWTVNNYTITFDSNGGPEVSDITAAYGSAVSEPDNPTRGGYTFARWYSDENLTNDIDWTNLTMPLNGTTYYANWIDNYTITFDSNGGNAVSDITAAYGSAVNKPEDPTKDGYTFAEWYSDEDLTNEVNWPVAMPSNNVTYYAKWTVNNYTITFDSNGGSEVSAITAAYGSAVSEPDNPTKDGYTFAEWYLDDKLNTPAVWNGLTMPLNGDTYYAKWTAAVSYVPYVFTPTPVFEPTPQSGTNVEYVVDKNTTGTVETIKDTGGEITKVETDLKDDTTGVETKAIKTDNDKEFKTTIPSSASKTETGVVATIDDNVIKEALKQIEIAAEKTGMEDVKPVVEIVVSNGDKTGTTVEIPAESLKTVADTGANVSISSESGKVVIDSAAASTISENAGNISIMIGLATSDDLNDGQIAIAGDNTVVKIEAYVGETKIHELGGNATVCVPYTLGDGEIPENIVIFYLDNSGIMTKMETVYDVETKEIKFETNHFSYYVVAFEDTSSSISFDMNIVFVVIGVLAALAVVAVLFYRHSRSAY